ncbi:hypothetical protein EXIGLDRAFT_836066 [Exidia glandulosa HHB12029]|uniref:LysM domain-containing protein n=1 Tax=Exidia glandulosa HHB12029 TaxID=1314781 RepID=A0A165I6Z2_EXIGL|nr:hypothetical protein EXIGLDRAFT_836066 [Exidia glandulosa HHB12029]
MVSFALKIVTAIVSAIGVAIMIWQMVNMLHKSTPSSGDSSDANSSGGNSGNSSGGESSGDNSGNCSGTYTAVAGDTCTSIAQNFAISVHHFLSLNPSVSSDCTNLHIGFAYCIESSGTDSSVPAAERTPPSRAIPAPQFGVSVDQFLSLNPSVSPDCTNLHIGTAYCV